MKAILAEPYTGVEPITDSLRPVLIRRMGMLWLPEVELLLLYQLSYPHAMEAVRGGARTRDP